LDKSDGGHPKTRGQCANLTQIHLAFARAARIVKGGFVRGEQRYKCKECGIHFVEGDARTSGKIAALKALGVVLYSLAKGLTTCLERFLGATVR
jgi:transposase-like protein